MAGREAGEGLSALAPGTTGSGWDRGRGWRGPALPVRGGAGQLWGAAGSRPCMVGEDGPVQKSRHGTCRLRHRCGSCVHTVASAPTCPHPCPVSILTGIGRSATGPPMSVIPLGPEALLLPRARGPEPISSGPAQRALQELRTTRPVGLVAEASGRQRELRKMGLSADFILKHGRGAEGSPSLDVQGSRW